MNSQIQSFFITAGVVVSVGLIILGAVYFNSKNQPGVFVATETAPLRATDHVRGAASSTVSVIEYGDYQCPACAQYEPTLDKLRETYGGRVAFAFRHFPLIQIHANAMPTAKAAEAAGLQNKYWEMHEMLYSKQSEWSLAKGADLDNLLNGYATSLGLNLAKVKTDMASEVVAARIQADMNLATEAEVNRTPTFFINGKQIKNPGTYEEFAALLDQALAGS